MSLLALTVALMALPATTTFADAACKMIMQELKEGRTPQDVMDTYLATPRDMKACRKKPTTRRGKLECVATTLPGRQDGDARWL